jgi:hypothetical protein
MDFAACHQLWQPSFPMYTCMSAAVAASAVCNAAMQSCNLRCILRTRAHAIVPSAVCVSQLTSSYTSVTYTVLEAPNNEHSSVYLEDTVGSTTVPVVGHIARAPMHAIARALCHSLACAIVVLHCAVMWLSFQCCRVPHRRAATSLRHVQLCSRALHPCRTAAQHGNGRPHSRRMRIWARACRYS